jgi:DNA polymerase III alpha subunit
VARLHVRVKRISGHQKALVTSPWSTTDYVELHCHSSFSLLDATVAPAELVARAADLGMEALALTDHDALYGAVSFVTAARARGIHPILGAAAALPCLSRRALEYFRDRRALHL